MDDFVVENRPSQGFEIHTVWVWVAVDHNGGEGIISAAIGGQNFPLVASTLDTAISLRGAAQRVAANTGRTVRLIRLDTRTVVQEIVPTPSSGVPG